MTGPADGRARRIVRGVASALALLWGVWATLLFVYGGFDANIGGFQITSHDPLRPLLVAATAMSVLILTSSGAMFDIRRVMLPRRVNHRVLVGVLTVVTFVLAFTFSTTAASGADAYGYVSQADLWLNGSLKVPHRFVGQIPWESPDWTFSPLGYRPHFPGYGRWPIVPTYSPGLPLLMAGAKLIGGHCAMFVVVPLMTSLLVLMTYLIGCRLGSPGTGLIGAWFVASSPTVLFFMVAPMTDVPVAVAWATAFYFLLGRTRTSAAAAGIAAGIAILIRPNLFFGAAILGLWYLMRMWRDGAGQRRRAFTDGLIYSAGVTAGCVATAVINNYLFGSPLTSGYGGFADMLAREHVWPNLKLYSSWLVESQTPFVLLGLAALVFPVKRLWPGADRAVFVVIGLFVASLWAMYCSYLVFEEWWYLRFLLSMWPFMMLGLGAVAMALLRTGWRLVTIATIAGVLWLGAGRYTLGWDHSVFHLWQGERRYVSIGRLAATLTDPNSVIYSMQHSGSLRYYGGRMTFRYDNLDGAWLDRSVAWFAERGVHPYLIIEEWEAPRFAKQFPGQRLANIVETPPILMYKGPATVLFFDLLSPRAASAEVEVYQEDYKNLRCVPPAPPPTLVLK